MEKQQIPFKIRGRADDVYRVLGAGFLKQVYRKALVPEPEARDLDAGIDPVRVLSCASVYLCVPLCVSVCFRVFPWLMNLRRF
ncbi:MAG: GxxExxY protein [Gammaproteobacteria bacterium]|nr:GxxExxY protein [Gammaproteobacteria bacterium]MDH3411541.1 GxxExxY protein [Gammaproteobacteria bacterium]